MMFRQMRAGLVALMMGAGITAAGPALAQSTLETVRENDRLRCGVNTGLSGFSTADSQGRWQGIDVDYCRAVAAAVLGDADKVTFTPLSAQARFTALQSGEIDILARNTTWTLSREAALGTEFAGTLVHDGQGFLVPSDLGVNEAAQLDGAAICVQMGTTTELNLTDWFRTRNLAFEPVVFERLEEVRSAFFSGRCDALTSDRSQLAAIRANDAPDPEAFTILPDTISKEPLGPAVRRGDPQWSAIARWVLFALIDAEERGVDQANAADLAASADDPRIRRLLGAEGTMGEALGLDNQWALRAIMAVGNYGEMFERHLGAGSAIGLERGLNALWTEGGIMYAPPIR